MMKNLILKMALLGLMLTRADALEPDISPVLNQTGKLLFSDDFEGTEIKPEWVPLHGTQWRIVDGTLQGRPSTAEYQADKKARGKGHSGGTPSSRLMVPTRDCLIQFSFKLSDSLNGAHFGFNDGSMESGTGHVCRVTISTKGGIQLIKDKNSKKEGDEDEILLTDPFKVEADKWVTLLLEIKGPEMVVQISGGPTLRVRHSRIDIPRDQINLPTRGGGTIYYDQVRVWQAKAGK